jgi:CRP-like cAMP-binding protein
VIRRRPPSDGDLEAALGVPLLEPFSKQRLARLAGPNAVASYSEETSLFAAGDPADRFFVLLEGSVRLYTRLADGRETTISLLGAPTSFGEAAILSSGVFPVDATAAAGSVLLHIGARDFLAELVANPDLALHMLQSMRRWELRLLDEIRQAKMMSPIQRLAGYLLALGGGRNGRLTLKLPLRKTMLADRLGMKPETLSRNLQRLAEMGVSSTGDIIEVEDAAVLARLLPAPPRLA